MQPDDLAIEVGDGMGHALSIFKQTMESHR